MASLNESGVSTFSIASVNSLTPTTLARAADRPMRLIVRNVGAVMCLLATSDSALTNAQGSSDLFKLPVGASEVFVLAEKQAMYAVAQGANGELSVAYNDAWPWTTGG